MATGLLANGVCYESLTDATDAYFSSIPVASVINALGVTVQNAYIKYPLGWGVRQTSTSPLGVVTVDYNQYATVPVFPPCVAPSEFFYAGVEMGGWLVGTLVIGWAFTAFVKSL